MSKKCWILAAWLLIPAAIQAQELEAIQLYTQDELLALIQTNSHLKRVLADDCQLVRDIDARADIMQLPAYQFVCRVTLNVAGI